jgi:hypothetical protein
MTVGSRGWPWYLPLACRQRISRTGRAPAGGSGESSGEGVAASMAQRPWEQHQRGRVKNNLACGIHTSVK